MLKDNIVFLREFFKEFESTGTFFPSSRWAADALAQPIRVEPRPPMNILEAGPGSGPVTVRLLKYMGPKDTLTICEINPRFMQALKEKLSKNLDFLANRERVFFFEGPVQDLPEEKKFDAIICAIPFLNFEVAIVKEIFAKLKRLSLPGTKMTYFEYIGLRRLGKYASLPDRKRRIRELDGFLKDLFGKHCRKKEPVWLNVLPIYIYTLELEAMAA